MPESSPARNLHSRNGTSASQAVPVSHPSGSAPSEDFARKKQTKNANQANKRPSQQYRLLASEVPDDIGGLQVIFDSLFFE